MIRVFGKDVPLNRIRREIAVFHGRVFAKLDMIKGVSPNLTVVINELKEKGLVELKESSGRKEVNYRSLHRTLDGSVYKDDFWERLLRYGTTKTPIVDLKDDVDYLERRFDLL